jgi:hypothetical protein
MSQLSGGDRERGRAKLMAMLAHAG